MNRRGIRRDELLGRYMPALCLLSACFLLGAIMGSFFAAGLPESADRYVESYIRRLSASEGAALFKSSFWPAFLLLALVFFSGFGRLNALVVPAVFLVRGFMMSLAITAFIRAYGFRGYLPAVLAEFFSGFVITLSLFLLSLSSFSPPDVWLRRPGRRVRAPRLSPDPSYYMTAAVCLAAVLLAALLYAYLMPPLARAALLMITS